MYILAVGIVSYHQLIAIGVYGRRGDKARLVLSIEWKGRERLLTDFREDNLVGIELGSRWVDRQSIQTEGGIFPCKKVEDAISTFGDQEQLFRHWIDNDRFSIFRSNVVICGGKCVQQRTRGVGTWPFDYIKGHFRDAFFVVPDISNQEVIFPIFREVSHVFPVSGEGAFYSTGGARFPSRSIAYSVAESPESL